MRKVAPELCRSETRSTSPPPHPEGEIVKAPYSTALVMRSQSPAFDHEENEMTGGNFADLDNCKRPTNLLRFARPQTKYGLQARGSGLYGSGTETARSKDGIAENKENEVGRVKRGPIIPHNHERQLTHCTSAMQNVVHFPKEPWAHLRRAVPSAGISLPTGKQDVLQRDDDCAEMDTTAGIIRRMCCGSRNRYLKGRVKKAEN